MIPEAHFEVGGIASSIIAVLGTALNVVALLVLADKKLRRNPTTILVIALTVTNTIYTGLILPFNSVTLLRRWYFEQHTVQCKAFAYIFYTNMMAKILLEASLAINRWAAVCTTTCRFKRQTSLAVVAAVWLLSHLTLSAATLFSHLLPMGWDPHSNTCTVIGGTRRTVVFISFLLVPYVVICLCYVHIVYTLRASRKTISRPSLRSQLSGEDCLKTHRKDREDMSKTHMKVPEDILKTHRKVLNLRRKTLHDLEPRLSSSSLQSSNSFTVSLSRMQSEVITHRRRVRKEKGMVILVGCILLSYLVAYLPVSIVRAYQLDYAHIPTYILVWLTVLLNPVIYVASNSTYRAAARRKFNYQFDSTAESASVYSL